MNKILIATNALPPVIGGLENLTHDIATYLSHPDKSVTVLVSKKPLEGYKDRKYNVLYLKSITLFKRLPIPLPTFSNIEILFNLRKEYFDAILLQSHLFVSNWLVAVTVDKFNNKIWLNYGGGYVSHRSRIISSLIRFYEKFGWALLNSKSTCVLSQSEKSAIRFESLSGRKSNVIGNCVPNELIELEPIKYSGNSFKKFLFVGRLVEDKGIMSLLSIYADCIQSLVEDGVLPLGKLQLTIVGDGPLSSKISKFLEARPEISYRLLHLPTRNQVIEEMRRNEVLLQFPMTEGQPGVTLEAISLGLVVLTTPIDACLEELDRVYVASPKHYSELLRKFILGQISISSNVDNNKDHLRLHHSLEVITQKLLTSI